MTTVIDDFETFFRVTEPRLRRAYSGRLAPDRVADAVGAAATVPKLLRPGSFEVGAYGYTGRTTVSVSPPTS